MPAAKEVSSVALDGGAKAQANSMIERLREESRGSFAKESSRLVGWLIAGNIAGLYFVLDRAEKLAGLVVFGTIYAVFLAGAIFAVLGLIADLIHSVFMDRATTVILIASAEIEAGENEHDKLDHALARLEALRKSWLFVQALPVLSAVLLGIGLASPLWLFPIAWS